MLALRATRDADAVLLADMAARGLFFPPEQGGRFGVSASLSAPPRPSRRSADLVPHDRALADDLAAALERWPLVPCARVVAAHKMVTADLRRPAIAIDAGKVHHELMTGWGRAAQEGKLLVDRKPDRAELFLPGSENRPATLSLPLDGESLSQAFVEAIKEWRSFLGLRHWIALQALFSIQGKREGRVLWKLDEHLNALGVSKRWREDPENRASVVREVSLLTKMQLVVYRPDGTVRARHNVLVTTAEIDVERGGEWQLEGLELQMHPWLYNGVRDQKTGQLGKHWHPVPPELAKVDHDKFRHALVLGLMLPIRWKWIWAHQGVDHIQIEARKLLDLACIDLSPINPGRAWKALERSLAELERINLLGHVEWSGEPHTLAAQVRLYPADWLLDRTLQGLRPIEQTLPAALPTTGDELIAWRKDRGFTQRELARRLGVGLRTVKRDEVAKDKALGRTIAIALKALSNRPGETPQPPAVDPEPEPGEPPPPSS